MMTEIPDNPALLLPPVASYVSSIAEAVGDVPHAGAADRLAGWIASNLRPGEPLEVVVVCTGNSRRSILGATMGNVASAHFGLPEVRFSSGGTDPSAFNTRTVDALRAVGIEVSPTGDLAPPGPDGGPNPVYRIRWGAEGDPAAEAIEFSKRYDDPSNPRSGFAALMVCDEADASCPVVTGASLRLSIPFADPKEADDTPEEASRYAERRDDLARLMARALSRAKERLNR
ncbi:low molecular weight phosphatase family protein [Tautonia plasticadhaerens]|uniref:Protein ArsC n=1 Tax=Tautonia plasticadhaerens TaxID=2527974 RepID=A0A518HDL6_9BACT|nr:protein-tyrosine-phosphatase [Tautonia plasticadhaerens]QDV38923.1 Protein ArsC [Tautonia plasticadhaerens]